MALKSLPRSIGNFNAIRGVDILLKLLRIRVFDEKPTRDRLPRQSHHRV
jgi:hypothetical protein